MQTVLVTGAEGFVGRFVVSLLQKSGYEVIAGVRNRARKLAHERQHGRALVCDVSDAINVARTVASVRPDGVIHLAGMVRPSDAADEPLEAYQCIVTAWANILDAVRRVVPRAKVVLASACDVYGNSGADGAPLREDSPAKPVSTFGSMKRAAETIAHTFFRDYHLNITIARPFHCTGPGQSDRSLYGAIATKLAEIEGAQRTELWLPGLNNRRDLLHVEDAASAYEKLLIEGKPNETYNICSGQAFTSREVAEQIAAAMGRRVDLTELPTPENDAQVPVLIGDNTKLREQLGWQARRSPADALRDVANSFQPVARRAIHA